MLRASFTAYCTSARRRREATHETLQREQLLAAEHGLDLAFGVAGGAGDDLLFFLVRRIADAQLEHEAVELRFGQRVRAFLLDRVLRGEHEERMRQVVRAARPR